MGKDYPDATTTTTTPYGASYLDQGLKYGSELLEAGAPGYYPGELVAPRGPLFQEGQQAALEAARSGIPGMMGTVMPAWQSQLQAPDIANNPYVQAMNRSVADQAMTNYERFTRPGIADQATAAGMYGGSRQGVAEALGFSETQRQIADAISRNNMQAYGQGLQSQAGAIGQLPMLTGQMQLPTDILQGQAGLDQQQQQRIIDAETQRHLYDTMQPWDIFQRYMTGSGVSGGTVSQPFYAPSGLQQAAGGLTGLLGTGLQLGRGIREISSWF